MRAIDGEALYEKACDLEAQALAYVRKIANDETKIEEWRIWSAILVERTAFKHDIFDAPEVKPRCEECETFNKTRLLIPQPERKKGKWLFKERREPVYDLSGVKTWGIAYMCSECGFIHTVIEDFGQYAYCPNSNCGAEMRGEG